MTTIDLKDYDEVTIATVGKDIKPVTGGSEGQPTKPASTPVENIVDYTVE